MEIDESSDINRCEDRCQDVVALKIFDQCKIEECEALGPVVSKEKCECIILSPFDNNAKFGCIIIPDHPIKVPQSTARVKIIKNSFRLTNIEFINLNCSIVKKNYWSVDIIYHFEFKLQFLGINMKPLKIKCCPTTYDEMKNASKEKEYIKAGVCFASRALLYGGDMPSTQVFSDIVIGNRACNYNDPHIMIEVNAYPLDVSLKDPCDLECEQICNDTYCEPFYFICITIALSGIIKLIRLICGVIHVNPCTEPRICDHCIDDPCKYFSEMEFPKELF